MTIDGWRYMRCLACGDLGKYKASVADNVPIICTGGPRGHSHKPTERVHACTFQREGHGVMRRCVLGRDHVERGEPHRVPMAWGMAEIPVAGPRSTE